MVFAKTVWVFAKLLKYDMMIIGGLFAYLLFSKSDLLKFIYRRDIQLASYLIIIVFWLTGFNILDISSSVLSVLYGVVILNIASNKKSLLKLDSKLINLGGKLSYGMYMYHSLTIAFFIHSFKNQTNYNIIIYSLTFTLTIIISYISYQFFEKPILKYKEKYMVVKSSN